MPILRKRSRSGRKSWPWTTIRAGSGARAAGLGWADRLGGGALGALEGAVVTGVLLTVATTLLGRDHDLVRDTHSLAVLAEVERISGTDLSDVDVAAPPR